MFKHFFISKTSVLKLHKVTGFNIKYLKEQLRFLAVTLICISGSLLFSYKTTAGTNFNIILLINVIQVL